MCLDPEDFEGPREQEGYQDPTERQESEEGKDYMVTKARRAPKACLDSPGKMASQVIEAIQASEANKAIKDWLDPWALEAILGAMGTLAGTV